MRSEISRLLRQRGHEITVEGGDNDILLPACADKPEVVGALKLILYNLMRQDQVRRSFRDWAYDNSSPDGAARSIIESYVNLCQTFGKLDLTSSNNRQSRYAKTFEWYISELFLREFAARASGFGIRLKDAEPDDEFDCIALLDGGAVFVECKTGKGSVFDGFAKFMRRDYEIAARYSFYIFDRDYTFSRQGDDIPRLSNARAEQLGIQEVRRISVSNQTFFSVAGGKDDVGSRYFLVCGGFRGFEDRIRYMIRYSIDEREEAPWAPQYVIQSMPFTN
jgi:hypothetical protein